MAAKARGRFIDPMLLLRTDTLPNDGTRWQYQLKFDGYRAIAFKTGGRIHLRSRNDNDFSIRYSGVVKGLAKLPDETVIDGEVIALDEDGRPSFNILQNYGSSRAPVLYFVFDVMVLAGRDVMREPLEKRRELLEKRILPKLTREYRAVEAEVSRQLGNGLIDATYFCPHRPDQACDCRKPAPGLVLQAASEHHLDLRRSFFIGDKDSDMQCGRSAGVKTILVRTGYGEAADAGAADFVVPDIAGAANLIIERHG